MIKMMMMMLIIMIIETTNMIMNIIMMKTINKYLCQEVMATGTDVK